MASLKLVALAALCALGAVEGRVRWKSVDGKLEHVSVGRAGVWGVNKEGKVYMREETYARPADMGDDWLLQDGTLVQLDVGHKIVWGVNDKEQVYFRKGITNKKPEGKDWEKTDGRLSHITVAPSGAVWGVNKDEQVYYREEASQCKPEGKDWKRMDGKLVQISAGFAGVWGVNKQGKVYYREGTFGDTGEEGDDWKLVSGDLRYVSSGDCEVIGIDDDDKMYIRDGITRRRPEGRRWRRINGEFKTLDSYSNVIWALNDKREVFRGKNF